MDKDKKIILASKSPRRQELLALGGFDFDIHVSNVEEVITKTNPAEVVMELSMQKAKAVYDELQDENVYVVGADTVVSIDGEILGKPVNEQDAFEMLTKLQGRTHEVYTGVTVVFTVESMKQTECFYDCTKVTFYPMNESEIRTYIKSGDPMDKAGAYGIQSGASIFVKGITGDYNNVVGLPLAMLYQKLKDL